MSHLAPDLRIALAALGAPALLAVAALLGGAPRRVAARLGLALTAAPSLVALVAGASHGDVVRWAPAPLTELTAVRSEPISALVLALVGLLGAVLLRFTRTSLAGDPGRERALGAMVATLACVSLWVVTNHLLVLGACWTGTSLAVHRLLTHVPSRTGAQLAAHKKFLASRLADLALIGAAALLVRAWGTLSLDHVAARASEAAALPVEAQGACLLVVACVALKSAQLPFHGWLTQVMEAPTPVSALLHAGVVNLGGLLLLRSAELLSRAPVAMTALVVVGTSTAVLGALVGATRPSVKTALAWSTISQMGFVLVQAGLGAWTSVVVHLVAHSLYKAHAFLSSGSAVDRWLAAHQGPGAARPSLARWTGAAALSIALVAGLVQALGPSWSREPGMAGLTLVFGLGVAPLVARGASGLVAAGGAGAAWLLWHAVVGHLVEVPAAGGASALRLGVVALGFGAGFAAQAWLSARPGSALSRRLHPLLREGLHLDEVFTRITFQLWPPHLPARAPVHLARLRE